MTGRIAAVLAAVLACSLTLLSTYVSVALIIDYAVQLCDWPAVLACQDGFGVRFVWQLLIAGVIVVGAVGVVEAVSFAWRPRGRTAFRMVAYIGVTFSLAAFGALARPKVLEAGDLLDGWFHIAAAVGVLCWSVIARWPRLRLPATSAAAGFVAAVGVALAFAPGWFADAGLRSDEPEPIQSTPSDAVYPPTAPPTPGQRPSGS